MNVYMYTSVHMCLMWLLWRSMRPIETHRHLQLARSSILFLCIPDWGLTKGKEGRECAALCKTQTNTQAHNPVPVYKYVPITVKPVNCRRAVNRWILLNIMCT